MRVHMSLSENSEGCLCRHICQIMAPVEASLNVVLNDIHITGFVSIHWWVDAKMILFQIRVVYGASCKRKKGAGVVVAFVRRTLGSW